MAGPEEPPISSHDERPVGGGSNNAAFGEDEAGLPGPAAADQWKLAAINYLHNIRGLGGPLDTMTRLHRLLRATRRLDGSGVMRFRPE